MARPLRIEYPGAYYHITSRGNEKKDIFKNQYDRKKFLSYLDSATQRYSAMIHVYCLMNNHYHLLMETPLGNLSQIMRHINGAYTSYFNKKHQRAGHLFQGRYKAILVNADEYAKELSCYIHLNPVKAEFAKKPERYPWSSYCYYIGREKAPGWLVRDFILGYFGKRESSAMRAYSKFVGSRNDQNYISPLKDVVGSTILGNTEFVREIKDKYLKDKKKDRNLPAMMTLTKKVTIEEIEKGVESVFGVEHALTKQIKLYICHKYSGKKLKEIGLHYGLSESGVSQSSRRISLKIKEDRTLEKEIKKIEDKLNLSRV